MDEFESLSHSRCDCKYHVVFIPKYRKKVLFGNLRRHLGEVFRRLAEQQECRIEEGHLGTVRRIPSNWSASMKVAFGAAGMGSYSAD